mmetsp:Transcript_31358/g.66595  ORF Transcript_31358/g.66595 Transcript_31358/m.66595 type:complete len:99 (+) Transcript_31358:679-975(+)
MAGLNFWSSVRNLKDELGVCVEEEDDDDHDDDKVEHDEEEEEEDEQGKQAVEELLPAGPKWGCFSSRNEKDRASCDEDSLGRGEEFERKDKGRRVKTA